MSRLGKKLRQRVSERMPEGRHVLIATVATVVVILGLVVYFGHFAPKLSPEPKSNIRAAASAVPVKPVPVKRVWFDDPAKAKPLGQGGIGRK